MKEEYTISVAFLLGALAVSFVYLFLFASCGEFGAVALMCAGMIGIEAVWLLVEICRIVDERTKE